MKKVKRIKKTNNINSTYRENITKILAAFFCIFPWITYTRILEYNEAEMSVFSSYEGLAIDFFLYYKERILIAMAVFVVCWFIGERIFPDNVDNQVPLLKGKNKWIFLLAGVFAIFALISTVFSEYAKNAWWGSPSEGEGLFTLLAYVAIIFAFYNYFATEYGLMLIKKAITGISMVTVLLSFVEYFYKPLVEIGFVRMLIAPKEYAQLLGSATAEAFDGAVSLTFNNPGYYGGFVCILLPFALSCFFAGKQKVEQMVQGMLAAGLMFCVIVSNSTAALYVAVAELLLVAVAYFVMCVAKNRAVSVRNEKCQNAKSNETKNGEMKVYAIKVASVLFASAVAVLLYSIASGNSIMDIITNANSATGKVVEDRYEIMDIELDEHAVILQGKENGLKVTFSNGQVEVFDEENQKLDAEYIDGELVFSDEAYKDVTIGITINSDAASEIWAKLMIDAGYDDTIDFFILRDGTFAGVGQNNAILKDIEGNDVPENLKRYYGIFTGRGYAWVNSMPILKDTILKGVGPGNFVYYFKQHDYVGMLQTHESIKLVIDKPHNAYLQYAINVGVLGMLGFFGLLAYAVVQALRMWWKHETKKTMAGARETKNESAGVRAGETRMVHTITTLHIGAIVAIIGFAMSSLMNDSIVTVTPTICMIAGLLLAMNYMLEGGHTNGKAKK